VLASAYPPRLACALAPLCVHKHGAARIERGAKRALAIERARHFQYS
jgi:hypothetical protein